MTYAEFYARFTAMLTVSPASDPAFTTYLPAMIQDAEAMCYRDLDPLVMRKQATVTLTPGVQSVSGPADWLVGRFALITSGTVSTRLQRREDSFLIEYAPDSSVTGTPKYWAETAFQTLTVAPAPDAAYPVVLAYTYQPAALSEANPSTWLTLWVPDLFFAAAMVQGTAYQRNWSLASDDPRMALSWKQQYDALLLSARRAEGRRKGDGVFDASQSPPPPAAHP